MKKQERLTQLATALKIKMESLGYNYEGWEESLKEDLEWFFGGMKGAPKKKKITIDDVIKVGEERDALEIFENFNLAFGDLRRLARRDPNSHLVYDPDSKKYKREAIVSANPVQDPFEVK